MKLASTLCCAALMIALALPAFGVPTTTNVFDLSGTIAEKNANLGANVPQNEPTVGGETIGTAVAIGALPFNDIGNTCGHVNDYDEACPYTGSTSPDVVYSYSPGAAGSIDITLCTSLYDTKVYVYANAVGVLVACNDDACGSTTFMSQLGNVAVTAGNTYYIVIDGYGGDCGDYTLNVQTHQSCGDCPAGGQLENEPVCGTNYVDATNGGCNSTPNVFSPVNCQTICGEAGTYLFNGAQYRDTDWYRVTVTGPATYTGIGDGFTLRLFVLTAVCPTTSLATVATPSCVLAPPLAIPGPGTFYLFAGTDVFTGVPCGSKYVLTITGGDVPPCITATENTSWGKVKGLFQ
jgi:hypothetical protein